MNPDVYRDEIANSRNMGAMWWNGSIFQLKKTPSRSRQVVRGRDGVFGRAGQRVQEALRLERLEKAGGRMRLVLVLVKIKSLERR
ncbi:MAG TPA: hypothetical protein VKU82_11540 [Planctomycetaceae bacterium]|nr:hypothetical protein [Planctomycetaceae bacterium]